MKHRVKRLPLDKHEKFMAILSDVKKDSRFRMTKDFIQHGSTTVMSHCINVAYTAYYISHKLNIKVDEEELIRGALLHDYFLYDWHDGEAPGNIHPKLHGFYHPGIALRNATRDFTLSEREKEIIKKHMWPLTVKPPKCREAWVVCLADKYASTLETLKLKKGKISVNYA